MFETVFKAVWNASYTCTRVLCTRTAYMSSVQNFRCIDCLVPHILFRDAKETVSRKQMTLESAYGPYTILGLY